MFYSELPRHTLYLDPGSGSILLQLIIAALVGISLFVRSQWNKIKSLFNRESEKQNDGETYGEK